MQNKENEERNKRTYVDKNLKPGMVISTAPLNNNKKNPVDVLSYNPIIKGKFTFEQ